MRNILEKRSLLLVEDLELPRTSLLDAGGPQRPICRHGLLRCLFCFKRLQFEVVCLGLDFLL